MSARGNTGLMQSHAPVAVSAGPLDVGGLVAGEQLALDTQVLMTTGIDTKTCPYCAEREVDGASHRSFIGGGRTVFARVTLTDSCAICHPSAACWALRC
jgi:hypothetical protein